VNTVLENINKTNSTKAEVVDYIRVLEKLREALDIEVILELIYFN
jgi:hypothetical protein